MRDEPKAMLKRLNVHSKTPQKLFPSFDSGEVAMEVGLL